MANGVLKYSEKQKNQLFKDVHSGKIHLFNLPKDLYFATANELIEAVKKGFNVNEEIQNIVSPDTKAIEALTTSIYKFSSAKQFQFISDMQNFLFDERGLIRPFGQFKKLADVINTGYNKNWLEAEYITSINMAKGSADWNRINSEKKLFPFLKYETLRDSRVRSEHASLHGIVKKVDDPFWSEFMPPNGWRCRCNAVQLENSTETNLDKRNIPKLDPIFDGNSGKRQTVFKKSHPYFKVKPEFAKHKADNFGLPIPKKQKTSALNTAVKIKISSDQMKALSLTRFAKEASDIIDNQNGASEIATNANTVVLIKNSAESNAKGSRRFADLTDSRNVVISSNSNGLCNTQNKYMAIKMKSGDNLDFEEVKFLTANEALKIEKIRTFKGRNGQEFLTNSREGSRTVKVTGVIQKDGSVKYWSASTASKLSNKSVAPTLTHETAHLIHNQHDPTNGGRAILRAEANKKGIKITDSLTMYGETNWSEFWAEQMTIYIHSNKHMKKNHLKMFNFIEDMFEVYGIDKKTIRLAK
jgi:SPP1 gp7 family putative phage head morphogenesis protein